MDNLSPQDVRSAVVSSDEKVVRVQGTRKRSQENLDGITPGGSSQPTSTTADNTRTLTVRKRHNRNAVPQGNKQKSKSADKTQEKKKGKIPILPDISKLNVRPPLEKEKLHLERRGGFGALFLEQEFFKNSKAVRQRFFDIPDLYEEGEKSDSTSSDENTDEWFGPENYSNNERDEEWFGIEREYRTVQTNTTGDMVPPERHLFLDSKTQLDVGCEEFMASMKYFWWALILGGRMPFQTYVEDRNIKFKFNKLSFQFFYFSLTSAFLAFCTGTMAYSFIRIFTGVDIGTLSFYERIERLDVDKYWIYAVVTFAASAISSFWSLASVFKDGYILADYLSRWNVAISALKYRPIARIRLYFWLNALVYLSYSAIAIYLFETDHVPAVKGASGLIGLTIFRPFAAEIRFSRNFPHVQRFGLFVHLYAVFSSRAILLMVTLYCKLLVNMARKWNLRLAYVMGMLGETLSKDKVVAVISYQKLFLEHTIIAGFLRHTGRIFSVALGIFYSLKICELVLLTYSAVSLIIHPRPTFNDTVVRGTPDYLPTITYKDPLHAVIGTVIILLLHNIVVWFINTEQITAPGEAILDGFSFIRRWGLMLSKTSQRRRFVQSITHAFSQKTDYYIRAGFTINREFTFNMFFWLATFTSLLIAFHPFQLQKELITVCSEGGNCVVISRTRIAWRSGGTGSSKEELAIAAAEFEKSEDGLLTTIATLSRTELSSDTRSTGPTTTKLTTPTTTATTISTTKMSTTTTTTTTIPTTTLPPIRSTSIISCPGIHDGRSVTVRQPAGCYQSGHTAFPFEHYTACLQSPDDRTEAYRTFGELALYDCEHQQNNGMAMVAFRRDTCGNIPLHHVRTGVPAALKAVKVKANGVDYIFCCYDYGFPDQLQYCNLIFSEAIEFTCGVGFPKSLTPVIRYLNVTDELKECLDNPGSTFPTCGIIDDCFCEGGMFGTTSHMPIFPTMPGEKIRCS